MWPELFRIGVTYEKLKMMLISSFHHGPSKTLSPDDARDWLLLVESGRFSVDPYKDSPACFAVRGLLFKEISNNLAASWIVSLALIEINEDGALITPIFEKQRGYNIFVFSEV